MQGRGRGWSIMRSAELAHLPSTNRPDVKSFCSSFDLISETAGLMLIPWSALWKGSASLNQGSIAAHSSKWSVLEELSFPRLPLIRRSGVGMAAESWLIITSLHLEHADNTLQWVWTGNITESRKYLGICWTLTACAGNTQQVRQCLNQHFRLMSLITTILMERCWNSVHRCCQYSQHLPASVVFWQHCCFIWYFEIHSYFEFSSWSLYPVQTAVHIHTSPWVWSGGDWHGIMLAQIVLACFDWTCYTPLFSYNCLVWQRFALRFGFCLPGFKPELRCEPNGPSSRSSLSS